MNCDLCEKEIIQGDIYYDTETSILCEECIDGFIIDLISEWQRIYDPEGENEDFQLDLYRDK